MCKFIFPSINFKIEKWKWNEEYRIYVSSLGHFKDEHKKNMPIKINNKTGYCMITTPYGIKTAHRLVMLTFRPIPNAEDLTVDHLNHNKRCNELSNLEWVSLDENRERAKNDLYIDNETHSNNWEKKIIKTGQLEFNGMEAAVDYVYEQSARINQKYKEVIDKAIEYIESKNNGHCIINGEEKGAFTFVLDFDEAREFIWKLLEILKEVE